LKIGNLGHGWRLHGPQFQRWERCVVGVLGAADVISNGLTAS
jgi:hypothetical protein